MSKHSSSALQEQTEVDTQCEHLTLTTSDFQLNNKQKFYAVIAL